MIEGELDRLGIMVAQVMVECGPLAHRLGGCAVAGSKQEDWFIFRYRGCPRSKQCRVARGRVLDSIVVWSCVYHRSFHAQPGTGANHGQAATVCVNMFICPRLPVVAQFRR